MALPVKKLFLAWCFLTYKQMENVWVGTVATDALLLKQYPKTCGQSSRLPYHVLLNLICVNTRGKKHEWLIFSIRPRS